jgi:L-iditol 2-dehydrogenase
LGATSTVLISKDETPEQTSRQVIKALGQTADVSIDCAGFQSTVSVAVIATKPGGVLVITGLGQTEVSIPLIALHRELDIRGVFRYKNTWPICRQFLEEGKIDVKRLITHRFPLERALEAFEVAKSGQGIKVIIDFQMK